MKRKLLVVLLSVCIAMTTVLATACGLLGNGGGNNGDSGDSGNSSNGGDETITTPETSDGGNRGEGKPDDENTPETPATEGLQYRQLSYSTCEVSCYTGTVKEVIIPSTYKGKKVTSIGRSAFCNYTWTSNSNITSITIPSSVTSIGEYAFDGCSSLTSITIPNSVTSIGYSAFENCSSLTSITIPNSVTDIGEFAFYGCDSLTSITVDEDNKTFKSIDGNLYVDDGKTLVQYAMGRKDTSFTIPSDVTRIGKHAFYGCSSLTSITIPSSVTSIGDDAFDGCSSLYKAGGSATYLGNDDNKYLVLLSVGSQIIRSFEINKKTKFIYEGAFYGCSSLTSITIPDSVTSIGNYAFCDCSSLTSVTIGSGLTSIGYETFKYCRGLNRITIPSGVTSIGESAFEYCSSLTSINVDKDNKNYQSIDGDLYTKDGKTLIQYAIGKNDMLFTIPSDVMSIGAGAFKYCSSLTGIKIPEGVTNIGDDAFYYCRNLTSIMIPNSVTSIGDFAFRDCSSLTSITIPDSVTSIGDFAFSWCSSLTEIRFNGTMQKWNAITKGSGWNDNTGNYVIHCTNGDISK